MSSPVVSGMHKAVGYLNDKTLSISLKIQQRYQQHDNMEITKTIQNKNKILRNGYAHVFKKNLAQGWVSYECERRRRYRDCTAKIRVKDGDVQVVSPHSHAPDPAKNEKCKVITEVREQATSSQDRPQQILGNTLFPYLYSRCQHHMHTGCDMSQIFVVFLLIVESV